jgi:hypothetical protein
MLLLKRVKLYLKNTFVYDVVQFFRQERVYWAWRVLGTGTTPHRVKQKTVLGYATQFSIPTLVESGTYLGDVIDSDNSPEQS